MYIYIYNGWYVCVYVYTANRSRRSSIILSARNNPDSPDSPDNPDNDEYDNPEAEVLDRGDGTYLVTCRVAEHDVTTLRALRTIALITLSTLD